MKWLKFRFAWWLLHWYVHFCSLTSPTQGFVNWLKGVGIPQWLVFGWVDKIREGRWGWKFCMGKTEANISKTNPNHRFWCPKVCITYFLVERWRFSRLGAFTKFVWEWVAGLSIICLIHKIALVWSISRNIFQRMDYAGSLAVQLKNVFSWFFWSTLQFLVPSRMPTP